MSPRPYPLLVIGLPLLAACGSGLAPTEEKPFANTAPTVEITRPEYGSTYGAGNAVNFQALVNDAETASHELGVAWSSSIDGDYDAGHEPNGGGIVTLTLTDLSVGGHIMTVTVSDEVGEQSSASTLVNIVEEGEPPTIVLLFPAAGDFGISGEDIPFKAVVDDLDDSLTELEVVFTAENDDGSTDLCSASADEAGLATCTAALDQDLWAITATVTDTLGQIGTDTQDDFPVYSHDEDDADGDGYTELEDDCDDEDDSVYPDAPEHVDGIDNDCDGVIDEGTEVFDDDGDGYSETDGDCDDDDPTTYLGAAEYVDGIDNDCDGEIDDETIAYDDDGDCYCEGGEGVDDCAGTSADDCSDDLGIGDCDDDDEDVHPGAAELLDGEDNDCDGEIDEGTDTVDDDGDGYSELDGDCDDSDDGIHPGATEHADGVDEDCDGDIDDGTHVYDDDGDGYSEAEGDCDDTDEDFSPDADEICDGYDNDCDDDIDGEDSDTDTDGDGWSVCDDDCDDSDASIHPGSSEVCNFIDDDCDGLIDESAIDAEIWYEDDDGDGYGDPGVSTTTCDEPVGSWVRNDDDCDDSDDDAHPGATEVCDDDDTDEDCDGIADGSDAVGRTWWYSDSDGDGYGLSDWSTRACDRPSGYSSTDGDCDDGDSSAHPGATEVCDDVDNDCDGTIDEENASGCSRFYFDEDGDTYGSTTYKCLCEAGDVTGYTAENNDDCCDIDGWAKPDASIYFSVEVYCGGWDYDCDGSETRLWTDLAECSFRIDLDACFPDPEGWSGSSAPACGDSGDWVNECRLDWWTCGERTITRYQACL